MTQQQNIETQQAFGEKVANGKDVDAIDALVAPGFVDHDPAPDQGPGPEGFKDFWRTFVTAFPDLSVEVDQLTADDDTVAIAYRASGTHDGPFSGIEPTGRSVDVRGVQITKFDAEGRMVERWGSSDELSILKQIGAVSA